MKTCFGFLFAVSTTFSAQLTGNLLLNPGAEAGSTIAWTTTGTPPLFVSAETMPNNHDNGFKPFEGYFMVTGGRDAGGAISQSVLLTGVAGLTRALIDTGRLEVEVGFRQLSLEQLNFDTANLRISFRNSANAEVNAIQFPDIASLNPTQAANPVWEDFHGNATIPPNTHSITFTVNFILNSGVGSDCDAYVDNMFLYVSDTQPLADGPRLSIELGAQISWDSDSGVPYFLETRPEAEGGEWNSVGTAIQGTGGRITITRPISNPRETFRVRIPAGPQPE